MPFSLKRTSVAANAGHIEPKTRSKRSSLLALLKGGWRKKNKGKADEVSQHDARPNGCW